MFDHDYSPLNPRDLLSSNNADIGEDLLSKEDNDKPIVLEETTKDSEDNIFKERIFDYFFVVGLDHGKPLKQREF